MSNNQLFLKRGLPRILKSAVIRDEISENPRRAEAFLHSSMEDYILYQDNKLAEYEAMCRHCGSCCGIRDGDPCEHLFFAEDGKSFCEIYNHRFGLQHTLSGKAFFCVPIRKIILQSWTGSFQCAYKKALP